jgi:prolyl oligopeptidase
MYIRTTLLLATLTAATAGAAESPMSAPAEKEPAAPAPVAGGFVYPETRRVDHVDELHGEKIADPYRWLEDLDSQETAAWVAAQNKVTNAYLEKIPQRQAIRQRLTELWNYERYGTLYKEGGRYFISRNDGLQNQNVLYTMDKLDAKPRVLLDPNTLSADGTVALSGSSVSEDGKLFAYGLASAGSDWEEWRVRDIETGKDLPDILRWVKFTNAAWTHDNKGFFYARYDEPKEGQSLKDLNFNQKLYYHRVGTPQSADELVYERPDHKEWGFIPAVSDDGRYLLIHVWKGTETENAFLYKDLTKPGSPPAPVVELLTGFDAAYNILGSHGTTFWFLTDLDAPMRRVIAIDVTRPQRENWREVIPQAKEALRNAQVFRDRFIANYLKDAHTQIRLYDLSGKPMGELPLPGLGSAGGFGGSWDDRETFYYFTGFTTPSTIYRYDLDSGKSTVFQRPQVKFDPEAFETRQVFYNSKDGTRVPMFLTFKKGLKLDGTNPTYLYGYGGFNSSMTPGFNVSQIVWMEMGGIYAVANLRGGGEYGEEWHQAGSKLRKQNTFDDFIAAAEYLIANRYTSRQHLAIGGHSNGGLLVGAALNQRPDLFGAVIAGVGVMDMLRFHKFTIGWGWVSDYGSPDNPEEFKVLRAYSPYHNIKEGTEYPAVLITTADHDDRVVPAHSFKYAAALQRAQGGSEPVLIRIETRAGHGGGKPVSKQIEESTDEMGFLLTELTGGQAGRSAASPAAKR